MNKYMAVIEYDGTGFNGFQTQPEGNRTVQKELTSVLSNILNREIIMGYAGRTDAGVHARGQVIDFTTEKDLDLYRIKWSLNNLLPGDISVKEIKKSGAKQVITSTYKAKPDNLKRIMRAFPEHKKLWEELYLHDGQGEGR